MSESSERSSDQEWLRSIYDRHRDLVFRYAVSRVGRDAAMDVVAETFIESGRSRLSFDSSRGSEEVWLLGIATNQIRRWRRAEARQAVVEESLLGAIGSEDAELLALPERLDAERGARQINLAVKSLPDGERSAILLHAVEGLSVTEVAASLQISRTAAKVRIFRARRRLRESLSHLDIKETA